MQNLIKALLKWIGAGIGIGIGILIVIVVLKLLTDKTDEGSDKASISIAGSTADNMMNRNQNSVPPAQQSSNVPDIIVPPGYRRTKDGDLILNAPIMGMEWESVEDDNSTAEPRIYEPFTIYRCITDDGEQLKMDMVNSDIGYMLKFYFAQQGQGLQLQAQQAAEEAYYAIHTNAVTLVMRDPDTYYVLTQYEDGDTTFYLNNAMTGHEINHFFCEESPSSMDSIALINQMEPEHFNFKPMTDELEEILAPQALTHS